MKLDLNKIRQFNLGQFFKHFTQESLIVVLLYILIIYVSYAFVIKSGYDKKKIRFDETIAKLKLSEEVKNLKKLLPKLHKKLYDTSDVNFFISLINKILSAHGVAEVKIVPGNIKTGYKVKSSRFSVRYHAHYEQMMKIFQTLEQGEKLNCIDFCEVNYADEKIDTTEKFKDPLLNVNMAVILFSKN